MSSRPESASAPHRRFAAAAAPGSRWSSPPRAAPIGVAGPVVGRGAHVDHDRFLRDDLDHVVPSGELDDVRAAVDHLLTPTTASPTTTAPPRPPRRHPVTTTQAPLVDAGGTQPFPGSLVGSGPGRRRSGRASDDRSLCGGVDRSRPPTGRRPVPVPVSTPVPRVPRVDPRRRSATASRLRRLDDRRRRRDSCLVEGGALHQSSVPPPPVVGSAQPVSTPTWEPVDSQPTGASFSPSGLAAITVPGAGRPRRRSAVWAEVETGTDGSQVTVSPVFSRAALVRADAAHVPAPQLQLRFAVRVRRLVDG